MRSSSRATLLICSISLAACAHREGSQAENDRLNRSIETLRAQNAAYAKQVEELENSVFILKDRLGRQAEADGEKAAAPALPTVTLSPDASAAASGQSAPAGTEPASEPEVEYAGDAAKPNARRPVLRMRGDNAEIELARAQPIATSRASAKVAPRKPGNAGAAALYRASFEALRAGRHEEAARGFREFLRDYPAHSLANNSQYWLGECFYDRKDYAAAVREFHKVIEHYPVGSKVPDAMLKMGFSYLLLGSEEAGRQTLVRLERSYPRHEAAALASSRLASLDHGGLARGGEAGVSTSGGARVSLERTASSSMEAP